MNASLDTSYFIKGKKIFLFSEGYLDQVKLLIKVLPIISKESCFALKGGTAINLFVRDLPRLSVDIDLTYIGFEDRDVAIHNINASSNSSMSGVQKLGIKVVSRTYGGDARKLICSDGRSQIKDRTKLYVTRICV